MAGLWLGIIWGLHFLLQRPTVANPWLYDEHIQLDVLRQDVHEHLCVTPLEAINATKGTKSRERFRTCGAGIPLLYFLLSKLFK